ncbi:MAG: response regulator [Bacteroidetes bacterium]|nr:response regulator [Fibrella sp.]
MKRLLNCIFSLFLSVLATTLGLGQVVIDKFRFEHITVNEGLTHSDAMCVAQDKQGFIWIGTNKGVDRYDGYGLKHYKLPVNRLTGSPSNRIRTLHVSGDGHRWAGVESAGLYWYDPNQDRFVSILQDSAARAYRPLIRLLATTNINAITSDRTGTVWIGTEQYGVFALRTDQQGNLTSLNRIRVATPPAAGKPLTDCLVTKLAIDRQGTVWIGTLNEGLWTVDTSPATRQRGLFRAAKVASLPTSTIRALHLDRHGDLWIGTDNQVFWVSARGLTKRQPFDARPVGRNFAGIQCLLQDSFNRLWVGTYSGMLLLNAGPVTDSTPPVNRQNVRTFLPLDTDPFSINSVRIHDILEDRFHNLWFATSAGGLNQLKLQLKPFGQLRRQLSGQTMLADNYINAIYKDEKTNQLWIGTRNGVARYDLTRQTYQTYLNQVVAGDVNGVDVAAIHQTTGGSLWIGTRSNGLFVLDNPQKGTLRKLPDLPAGLPWSAVSIESITEDAFGTVWVATFNTGLHRFTAQGKYLKTYSLQTGTLPTSSLTTLLYDRAQAVLWVSTRDAGLLKLRVSPDSLTLLKQFAYEPANPNSLQVNYTWPLQKDRQGNLWIGTIGGGLYRLSTNGSGQERIERYMKWVPETDIESLLIDEAGNLWIGGPGLYKFNPATKRLLHYDVADGLQSNAFKVGAAHQAADGTMYFGGTNGITYFQPGTIQSNPYPPLVQLTGLRIFNQSVAIGDTINGRVLLTKPFTEPQTLRIQASENDFSIEFVGLNYVNPQKHQYAYQLVGYNDDWVQSAPGQRTASFANLPPGDYTFRVKGCNGDGVWSRTPATLQLTVLPPWWKTWWAYLLYITAGIGALFVYHRVEVTQQRLKNTLALEKFKAEKEKEVTELKLRFFTNVSHELRTPLTLMLGPMAELVSAPGRLQDVKGKAVLVYQQTRKLLDLVNQLMEFRRVESGHIALRARQGDVLRFLTEIFLIFKLKAEECRLDYAMEAPTEPTLLYFDRSKLEIILTNLLSNAFKYTPTGGKIRVLVSAVGSAHSPARFLNGALQTNYLQITVRDWGVGMNADEIDRIFDPYYQASHTETLQIRGTGIGLSLVKQFVEAHSGEILVKSEPGAGTTFTLRLPFGQAHLSPTDIREETPATDELPLVAESTETDALPIPGGYSPASYSARILLVEDNDELRHYVQQLLTPMFEVFAAVDGVEGWEKTLNLLPDVVVSDVMMPRSDGLELCRRIKQHPKTMHIPVILLTAHVAALYELEGLETGADEYLTKPFNPRILHAKIAAMLHGRFQLKEYYQRQILLQPTETVIPDEEKKLLEKAMHIVETSLNDPDFNVQGLVRKMGMSQSAFYRQIKKISGQSVVEFIRDIRMKRAAQLLATGHLRVSEVAMMIGVEDIKHFRKTFQSVYNISPSDYARQHRETEKISE